MKQIIFILCIMLISCKSIKIDDFPEGSYKVLTVEGSDSDFKKIIYNSSEVIRENLILKFDKSISHFYILNNEKVISSFEKDNNNQIIHYAPIRKAQYSFIDTTEFKYRLILEKKYKRRYVLTFYNAESYEDAWVEKNKLSKNVIIVLEKIE